MKRNYDRNTHIKNRPYLQHIVNVHHFLQNLPVPGKADFFFKLPHIVKLYSRIYETVTDI